MGSIPAAWGFLQVCLGPHLNSWLNLWWMGDDWSRVEVSALDKVGRDLSSSVFAVQASRRLGYMCSRPNPVNSGWPSVGNVIKPCQFWRHFHWHSSRIERAFPPAPSFLLSRARVTCSVKTACCMSVNQKFQLELWHSQMCAWTS